MAHILVVNDDIAMLQLVRRVLEKDRHLVTLQSNAKAVGKAEIHSKRFHLQKASTKYANIWQGIMDRPLRGNKSMRRSLALTGRVTVLLFLRMSRIYAESWPNFICRRLKRFGG